MLASDRVPCLQVLGVLLLSAGALAILGSSQRNKNLLTASLLLSLLGTLLAFEFVVEVSHPDVTCAAMAQTASVSEPHPLVPTFLLASLPESVPYSNFAMLGVRASLKLCNAESLCLIQTLQCSESAPHSNFAMLIQRCRHHMSGSPDLATFQFWDLLPSQVNCSQLISRL